jgi:hypothetical protein
MLVTPAIAVNAISKTRGVGNGPERTIPMFELYIMMRYHGNMVAEVCERYETLELAIRQTIAMWPENDRPVSYMIMEGEECRVSMQSFGKMGCNAVVTMQDGTTNEYTEFEYLRDEDIIATTCKKDGFPIRIDHRW